MNELVRVAAGVATVTALVLAAACSAPGGSADRPDAPSSPASPSPTSPTSPSGSAPSPPPATPAEPVPPGAAQVTVTVVGDLMLGRGVAAIHPDPTETLRALRPLLRRADVSVGNLESTLSTAGPPTQGGDSFSAPPSVLDGLARAGIDALSLANNHTGDHGSRALVETVAAFRGSGIDPFGAGPDLRAALRPAVVEVDGFRVGLLAFNAIGETPEATRRAPGALSVSMPPRTGPLDRAELRRVLDAVRRLARRVESVVVLPHWGTQYTHVPEPVQSLVGRRLTDAGAHLVVGGHPHWVQGYEVHGNAVVVHSLGNAVFDMDFMTETMEGVVLTAVLSREGVEDVRFTPYRMDARFVPRPLRGGAGREVLADLRRHSRGRLPSARSQPLEQ